MDWDNVFSWMIQKTYDLEDYDHNISFSENMTYTPWS